MTITQTEQQTRTDDGLGAVGDIRTLHVILTLRCNYRCTFCFQPNFHDDLPEHVWREKLLPVYGGLRHVVLHGGEPTAVPRFKQFCDLVVEHNDAVRFSLFTNGFRFDDDYWPRLMSERGRFVNFSLNAATRDTYAEVNSRDNYDAVLAAMRRFRVLTESAGRGTSVETSFVIVQRNLAELAGFIRLSAELGVDRVRFFFDPELLPEDSGQVRAALDEANAARAELPRLAVWGLEVFEGRVFGTPVDARHLESTGCHRTVDNLYVGVGGDVSFCNFLHWRPIGNLLHQDLDEIWNSPEALAQRGAQRRSEWTYCVNAYCGPTGAMPGVPASSAALSAAGDGVSGLAPDSGAGPSVVVGLDGLRASLRNTGTDGTSSR